MPRDMPGNVRDNALDLIDVTAGPVGVEGFGERFEPVVFLFHYLLLELWAIPGLSEA
ncbi:MAG: hypothetical protein U5K38_13155 [Woeseiaceae bacterium]|nr:hypothetical protein [Woeseiaceae bacterium]